MSWLARLVNVFRAEKVSEDIDRELAFHLGERTDDLIADGASPEARRAGKRGGGSAATRSQARPPASGTCSSGWRRSSPICATACARSGAIRSSAVDRDPHAGDRHRREHRRILAAARTAAAQPAGQRTAGPGAHRSRQPHRSTRVRRHALRHAAAASPPAALVRRPISWRRSGLDVADQDGTLRLQQAALVSGNAFETIGAPPAPRPPADAVGRCARRPA